MSILGEVEAKKRRAKAAATTAAIVGIWEGTTLAHEYRASAVVLLQRETMTDLLVTEDGIDVTDTMPKAHQIEAMRELLAEAHELRAADLRGATWGQSPAAAVAAFGQQAARYLPRAMLHAETCATPDCPETDGLKQDGESAYCEDHR